VLADDLQIPLTDTQKLRKLRRNLNFYFADKINLNDFMSSSQLIAACRRVQFFINSRESPPVNSPRNQNNARANNSQSPQVPRVNFFQGNSFDNRNFSGNVRGPRENVYNSSYGGGQQRYVAAQQNTQSSANHQQQRQPNNQGLGGRNLQGPGNRQNSRDGTQGNGNNRNANQGSSPSVQSPQPGNCFN
jgi:hypothetical protein